MVMTDSAFDPVTLVLVAFGLVAAAAIYFRNVKREGRPQYSPATARQRVTSAVFLAAMLAAWAIYIAGWDLFGGYEKQVAGLVQLACMLYVIRLIAILKLQ